MSFEDTYSLWPNMYKLFECAQLDNADLLLEIQSIDPAILVALGLGVLSLLARKVVHWLQVSPVFTSTIT